MRATTPAADEWSFGMTRFDTPRHDEDEDYSRHLVGLQEYPVAPALTSMRLRVDTADPDDARDQLSKSYCPHALTPSVGDGPFRARQFEVNGGTLDVYRLSFGQSSALVDPVPFEDFFLLSQPLSGIYSVAARGEAVSLRSGQAIALDPTSAYRMRWDGQCEVLTVRLNRADVESAIAAIRGTARRSVQFPIATPSPQLMAAWNQVTRVLIKDFLETHLLTQSPLLQTEFRRLLIAAVVHAYPTVTQDLDRLPGGASSHAVGRAVEYIEAAAADDITLTEIAAAAFVSPRALQEGFRRHLETTPIAVLREVRLRRAHQELQDRAAVAGVTVSAVAAKWGFTNLGRFARIYRAEFGESPSDTLRS